MGFGEVYDYVPGRVDWFAAGLPREGQKAQEPTADQAASKDEVTCLPEDPISDVARNVRAAGKSMVIVTSQDGVVLGRIRGEALDADPDQKAQDVMEPGPTTIRANTLLEDFIQKMRSKRVGSVLVTTSGGKLIGALYLEEGERYLAAYGDDDEGCCCCSANPRRNSPAARVI